METERQPRATQALPNPKIFRDVMMYQATLVTSPFCPVRRLQAACDRFARTVWPCERAKLDVAPLATILEILRSDAFKEHVDRLEGYDPASCGEIVEISAGLAGRRQR